MRLGSEMDRGRKKKESVCGETAYLAQGIPYLVEHRSDNSNFSILGDFMSEGGRYFRLSRRYFKVIRSAFW